MIAGYVLAESIRLGARLEGLPLTLTTIERYPVKDTTPDEPSVWTTIAFEFAEEDVERVADALAEVLDEHGGWYTDFTAGGEKFVIFARRIFRYAAGDTLAVPVEYAHKVTAYLGDSHPAINRLHDAAWAKTKKAAASDALRFARELLRIAGRRKTSAGHAYNIDPNIEEQL